MKRFIKKTTVLLTPIVFLIFADIPLKEMVRNHPKLEINSFNFELESKISKLPICDTLNIIIAGDSRAERQLIPYIFESRLGIKTINIGISGGDLAQAVTAINRYNDTNIFVISASSWQINDGAIDPGWLSLRTFYDLTFIEQLFIYRNNFNELARLKANFTKHIIGKCFETEPKYSYDCNIIQENGFFGIEDTLDLDTTRLISTLSSHPWYKKFKYDGARWRIFCKNIEKLSQKKSLIIIYQPPVSPIWKLKTKNTEIDHFEKEYSIRLDSICQKHPNIHFYDFYSNDINALENDLYCDYQHLNKEGSIVFSRIFADIIKKEIETQSKTQ